MYVPRYLYLKYLWKILKCFLTGITVIVKYLNSTCLFNEVVYNLLCFKMFALVVINIYEYLFIHLYCLIAYSFIIMFLTHDNEYLRNYA